MERWAECEFSCIKDEWLTVKCRTVVELLKRDLHKLSSSAHNYEFVEKRKKTNAIVVSAWHLNLGKHTRALSDIIHFLVAENSEMENGVPTVVLIGFKTLTIEVGLRIWANVVIVSPQVCMKSVDLSAKDQAPPRVPSRAQPGKNGLHGTPGRPGGNLSIICQELNDAGEMKHSIGQRGGDGQNAGNEINITDTKYDRLRFRNDLTSLMGRLPSLQDWELVSMKLPNGMCIQDRSQRDLPPDNGHVMLTAAGSAITATAIAVSGCIPFVAPLVAPTMIPVGTGMIGKGLQRNTQTTLELVRSIETGGASGRRGQGGYGGYGGEFCVEAGQKVKKWRGPSGGQGTPGRSGKPCQEVLLKGKVTQAYGIFGCRRGEPLVDVTETRDSTCTQAARRRIQTGFSPEHQQEATKNPLIPRSTVQHFYDEAFAEFTKNFPRCEFPNVEMP